MKIAPKGVEPQGLSVYRMANPNGSWSNFRKSRPRISSIQTALKSDQGHLCAYCEIDLVDGLSQENSDMRVEHFHPKSDKSTAHNWALDWNNLLAVCHGGSSKFVAQASKRFTTDHSCDVPKSDKVLDGLILNPLQLPSGRSVFSFDRATGSASVDTGACAALGLSPDVAQKTIDELHLDGTRLRRLRKPALDKVNEQLSRLTSCGLSVEDAREALARIYTERDVAGKWPAFFSAIRCYLGSAAEVALSTKGYTG